MMPAHVHSDWELSFLSMELNEYLTQLGIAMNRTLPCNLQENGRCEHYNGIIWINISLVLVFKRFLKPLWEQVLLEVLQLIRSLLCTTT